jgi:hypothetical protein|tara:strand:- start:399 stop:698 length:300 start_codon:yes stop_codon:yes gene_type:complete
MATVGISASIDVSKIDKDKLIKGEKGTYLNITTFVNLDEKDQYDNNGMITQSTTKEEREAKVQGAILGNSRVFYTGDSNGSQPQAKKEVVMQDDEDLPF